MLTGGTLRDLRESAGLTQQQLGDALGVTLRSVGNWERAPRVPDAAERKVRRAFPEWFGAPASPLSSVSDAQLLAEIARRFESARGKEGGTGGDAAPITRAGHARDEEIDPGQFDLAARSTGHQPRVQQEREQQDRDAGD